nr:MAG TPA: hypothetical protein [Caudoviricetes sp.]
MQSHVSAFLPLLFSPPVYYKEKEIGKNIFKSKPFSGLERPARIATLRKNL